jgi:hypothetical protein
LKQNALDAHEALVMRLSAAVEQRIDVTIALVLMLNLES